MLADLGDAALPELYFGKSMPALLDRRNTSILAHGHRPIAPADYYDLRQSVRALCECVDPDFAEHLSECTFLACADTTPRRLAKMQHSAPAFRAQGRASVPASRARGSRCSDACCPALE